MLVSMAEREHFRHFMSNRSFWFYFTSPLVVLYCSFMLLYTMGKGDEIVKKGEKCRKSLRKEH